MYNYDYFAWLCLHIGAMDDSNDSLICDMTLTVPVVRVWCEYGCGKSICK